MAAIHHCTAYSGVNDVTGGGAKHILYVFLYFIFPNPLGRLYTHITRESLYTYIIYASWISLVFRAFWMKRRRRAPWGDDATRLEVICVARARDCLILYNSSELVSIHVHRHERTRIITTLHYYIDNTREAKTSHHRATVRTVPIYTRSRPSKRFSFLLARHHVRK